MHKEYSNFARFEFGRFLATVGTQMQSVALGWQVYELTHRPLDLGLIGLVQFAPIIGLSLLAGHVADRFDRRRVVLWCYLLMALCSLSFFMLSRHNVISTAAVFSILFVHGIARAFTAPSLQSLLPSIVTGERFSRAVAWHAAIWQVGSILGPALGGVIYGWVGGAHSVYGSTVACELLAFCMLITVRTQPIAQDLAPISKDTLLAGIRYIREKRMILGAISLDLFAVLLGGAVALMPAIASDILHVGPSGLGFLRSAPGAGAAITGILLGFMPIKKNAGKRMFFCVFAFGIATIAFGLSKNFYLSLACLIALGAFDLVSVVIRHSLVQLQTPVGMRGRVSAVNMIFISSSNELGEFESGLTAAWFGLVPAIILGGIGTCIVTVVCARKFPDLLNLDRLVESVPDEKVLASTEKV